jgi:phosphoribosylformylglycinamidine (FGAM) synthase PurS component
MKIEEVKDSVLLSEVVSHDTKLTKKGQNYVGLCPVHAEKTPSFNVYNSKHGERFKCHGCGINGDLFDYLRETRGLSIREAKEYLGAGEHSERREPLIKLPHVDKYAGIELKPDAPEITGNTLEIYNPDPDKRVSKVVKFAYAFQYERGKAVIRIETANKKITPMICWTNHGWTYYPFPEPRPLYGFDETAPLVIVVQGEKKAMQLAKATGACVVSAAGGDNAVNKTDWTVLKGREVIIWPDNDVSGKKAAAYVSQQTGGVIMTIAPEKPKGWDAGDWLVENPDADALEFIHKSLNRVVERRKDSWAERLLYKDGELDRKSINNVVEYLLHHEDFCGVYRYDDFHKQTVVIGEEVHPLGDTDITELCLRLERHGLCSDSGKVAACIDVVAHRTAFNPAQEYFNGLKWDGQPRLDGWLSYYLGADDEPEEYLAAIGKKWMTAAVKRVFEAGCKFDHMLIIEGNQNLGKSTALRTLATFGDTEECYFTDSLSMEMITSKDCMQLTAGSIIVELAELVGLRKRDDDEIKRWITTQVDKGRLPYARTPVSYPRSFVLAGTTNNYDYLSDPTGNRRFWPFKAKCVDIAALKNDRSQLWAEAVHNYKAGLYIGLTAEEQQLAEAEQKKRLNVDPWAEDVERALLELSMNGFRTDQVMKTMAFSMREKDAISEKRIKKILQQLGYQSTVKWNTDKQRSERLWLR